MRVVEVEEEEEEEENKVEEEDKQEEEEEEEEEEENKVEEEDKEEDKEEELRLVGRRVEACAHILWPTGAQSETISGAFCGSPRIPFPSLIFVGARNFHYNSGNQPVWE